MQNEFFPEVSIESEMRKSYLDYAMSVIVGRALPDVRDGLKPVHRRVLFAMQELKNDWNRPYKKSARIVGDVIGKYHPHGDTAVYDTIVRMAQEFSLRYPLVDGQGNFGSVDGDPPAAMRYTEVRMAKLAHEMLADLEKETVDFAPNYDESLEEPVVLPSRLPSLLVNGSSGIAVGMATNIPPHNLGEVIEAITLLIDNPDVTIDELIEILPGPDFPTAGMIYGVEGIHKAYKTGRGVIRVRARAVVEKDKRTGYETVVVTELPYMVNKATLIEKIAALVRQKSIEGVKFVRDESDREGMRIAVGLKRGQIAQVIINQLYKHTRMETSFGVILLAVAGNRPELMDLKAILNHFIRHRKEVVLRRTRFELRKAEERAHILEGLKTALDNLDEVVALIRASKTPPEAKSGLIERFGLSPIQAQAILDMRLQRLTGLEQSKIVEEYTQVIKNIARYREILSNERLVLNIIKDELSEINDNFGDDRRTEIVRKTREITIEDMIVEEDMVVTISKKGYIKRTPISLYRSQRRGGRGKTGMGTKGDDFVENVFVASTHHTFMFFTSTGKVHWRKVYEIPQAGRTSKGKAIVNLLNLEKNERLATVLAVQEFQPGQYVLMATRRGLVKKTDLMAYSNVRTGGIIALGLNPGDELIAVRLTDGTFNVFLGAANGKSIRFHETDVRPMGRVSKGVIGIRMEKEDQLVAMEVLSHGQTVFTITENGYGKRTEIDEYPIRNRGGKGVITIKTNERNGKVVGILLVGQDDDLMLMTDTGKIIRMPIEGTSVISRNTQGVRLINMEPGERVVGAVRLADKEAAGNAHEETIMTAKTDGLEMRIGVVGGGSWGTALANLLAEKGYFVDLWVYEPELIESIHQTRENSLYLPGATLSNRLTPIGNIEQAVQGKDLLLNVVPSHLVRSLTQRFASFLGNNTILVSASKGIENETFLTMSQVFKDVIPTLKKRQIAVLSGPSFAKEVVAGMATAVSIASSSLETAQTVQTVFSTPQFRAYSNNDVIGVELGGAVKNVIALAAGIIDGLQLGLNTRAALITRGQTEIRRLGLKMNANPRTFTGLAGMGDLILTCTGDLSRNHKVGRRIGQGETLEAILADMHMVAEGVKTARSVYHLSNKLNVEMPICHAVYKVLYDGLPPFNALQNLMTRDLKYEFDKV